MSQSEKTDVGIVGGGIAGLYTAFRLTEPTARAKTNRMSNVTLFEATDHLGGRLKSVNVPQVDFALELGAMRFKKRHRLLDGLMAHLGQEIGLMDIPGQKYFLRGRRGESLEELAVEAYLL